MNILFHLFLCSVCNENNFIAKGHYTKGLNQTPKSILNSFKVFFSFFVQVHIPHLHRSLYQSAGQSKYPIPLSYMLHYYYSEQGILQMKAHAADSLYFKLSTSFSCVWNEPHTFGNGVQRTMQKAIQKRSESAVQGSICNIPFCE